MTPQEFHTEFVSGITVCFNWPRFFAEWWPVSIRYLRDRADFERCYIPWYLDGTRGFINNTAESDPPFRACTMPVRQTAVPSDHLSRIQGWRQRFQQTLHPVVFRIPAYSLPQDRFLLLDGNHRFLALTLLGRPFSVTVCSIDGPIDGNCLMDLRYWQANPQA